MLRQEYFERAAALVGTDDFDRLFVVHAIDAAVLTELRPGLVERRTHRVTVPDVVADLIGWYRTHERPAVLCNTLIGDLLHLLVGFCGLDAPTAADPSGDARGAARAQSASR